MDKLTAFQFMVLTNALVQEIKYGKGRAADVFHAAFYVREEDLINCEELETAAAEFVDFQTASYIPIPPDHPEWLPKDYVERGPLYGGERG